MSIRAKRRRRLALLGIFLLAIAGGLVALTAFRRHQERTETQTALTTGMAAFEAEDYSKAATELGKYVQRTGEVEDPQVLYRFAIARLHEPLPRNEHIGVALASLRRAYRLDRTHLPTAEKLIELLTLIGDDAKTETLEIADQILATHPDHAEALRARAIALTRSGKSDEALQAADRAAAALQQDLQLAMLRTQLRRDAGTSPDELLAFAKSAAEPMEDKAHREVVLAHAFTLVGKPAEAAKHFHEAARVGSDSDGFSLLLVPMMDRAGLFTTSRAYLIDHAPDDPTHPLFAEAVLRAFEGDRLESAIELITKGEDSDEPLAPTLIAIKALAQARLGQQERALESITRLRERENDPLAAAWAKTLSAVGFDSNPSETGPAPKTEAVAELTRAVEQHPSEGHMHALLAVFYERRGELELAADHYRAAAELRPSWGMPRIRLAKLMLALGQNVDALRYAQQGMIRRLKSVDAATTLARARAANLGELHGDSPEQLLAFLDEIDRRAPDRADVLLLRVYALGFSGKTDEANALAVKALGHTPPLGANALARLVEIAERFELPVAAQLRAESRPQSSSSAQAVLAQALRHAASGDLTGGQAIIDQAASAAPPEQAYLWSLAKATYLDRTGQPGAKQAMLDYAESRPADVAAQRTALASQAVRSDREASDQLIKRLRSLGGENSLTWRIERARWLLGDSTPQNLTKAGDLLREVIAEAPSRVEPRLLLAVVHERTDKLALAVQELEAASRLRPESNAIRLDLARLLQAQRSYPAALASLEIVLGQDDVTAAEKAHAAALLARQGEDQRAIRVLEELHAAGELAHAPGQLQVLASLYARSGQGAKVESLREPLLKTGYGPAYRFLASYDLVRGDQQAAAAVIDAMQASTLPEDEKNVILGDLLARLGSAEKAASAFEAAVKANPTDSPAWDRLVLHHIVQGDAAAAFDAVDRGIKAGTDSEALKTLKANQPLITAAVEREKLRPLIAAIITDPSHRTDAVDAVRAIEQAFASSATAEEGFAMLRRMAEEQPDFRQLQIFAASIHLQTRRYTEAARLASASMQRFPSDATFAQLAAAAMAEANRWDEALLAAQEWRRRSTGRPLAADVLIARARLQLKQPQAALEALGPYLSIAHEEPDKFAQVIAMEAQALMGLKRIDDVSRLLSPRLTAGPKWRALWMDIASSSPQLPPNRAERWIEAAAEAVPSDAAGEKVLVSRTWWTLAKRTGNAEYIRRADAIFDEIADEPDLPASVWFYFGMVAEQRGEWGTAEQRYRKALELDDSLHAARNNLSMVLVRHGQSLEEAQTLAAAAVDAAPNNPNYRDTLATVASKGGDHELAIKSIDKAIELEPANRQWLRSKVELLEAAGRTAEAAELKRRHGL